MNIAVGVWIHVIYDRVSSLKECPYWSTVAELKRCQKDAEAGDPLAVEIYAEYTKRRLML